MKKNYLLLFTASILLLNHKGKAQCSDQVAGPLSSSIICNGSGTIGLASSQTGVNYYVRNDANDVVITGPVAGTGGPLILGTGSISASMIFNIYAVKATGALTFDGVNNYVEIANSFNSNGNFTWEAWIKTNSDGTIFSKTSSSGTWGTGAKSLFVRNGKIAFEVFGVGYVETNTVYNDNNWHHVAVTTEAGYLGGTDDRVRMYVDGMYLIEKNNWNINSISEGGLVNKIGYTNSDYPAVSAFNGIIDEVKIWTSVRTATDVVADMSGCLTGGEPGLVGYYQFEDGTGTTLTDISGANNTGTLTNMSNASWVYGRDNCASCSLELSQKPVFIITTIADQSLSAASPTLCSNITTSINSGGSEAGVNYYLRNDATYATITGPVAGTGGTLSFNSGLVAGTTTFNVLAAKATGALNFDGVDDYVMVQNAAALESLGLFLFTMEAWIYPTSVSSNRSIIRKDGDYNLYINNGYLVAETFPAGGNGGAVTRATSISSITPNVWTHVAATWNGTSFAIYINGISSGITASSLNLVPVSKMTIGRSRVYGEPFVGKMDEIRMWSSVRTVSQLTANINSCLTGTETSLIAYYKFEDGKGSDTLTDKSITAGHGVLSNMDNVNAWAYGIDNCGCTFTLSTKPSINTASSPTVSVNSGSVCSGNSFTIIPSGADAYTITGGNFTVTPNTTTSYSVTGTNSTGCVSDPAISTITVSVTPTITVNNYSVCSGNSIAIVPSGANNYTITGGSFTVTPASTTSYSITGSSTAACISSSAAVTTISVNTTPTVSVNSGTICSGGSFTITPTGAATYTVTGGNFTVTPAGTTSYSVTGTATNGCQSASVAVSNVTVYTTPTIGVNSATICSGNSVAIVPTGAAAYTITGNNFTVTPSSTTSYSVTGTSTAGCVSASAAVSTVSVNATPTITVNSATICSGISAVISPSGAVSYTITGSNFTVSPSATTSYSITGSTGSCMSATNAVSTVSVNTTPTISVNSATICSGASVVITPTGAGSYTITGNNFTVSPGTTTFYSVSGTATNGCVSSAPAVSTISVNTTPTISVNSTTICSGNLAVISPSGAASYTVTGNSFTVSPSSTTSYSVTGSNGACISATNAVSTVSVNTTPTVSVNSATICSGSSVAITPTGAATYTVTGNNFTVSPGVTTSYSVSGTATNGCVSATVVVSTISVNITPTITVNSATICSGSSIAITPTGAATYTITGNNFTVSPSSTTSYSVTGSNGSCVSATNAVSTISVNTTPTISVNSATICSGNSVVITPTGAATYTITGNNFTVTPGSTSAYSVTGTATNGCISSTMAVSNVSVNITPTVTVNNYSICSGGSVVITPTGASTYTITGNTFTVSPASNTSYTVTGTGTAGCTSSNTAVANVTVNALPTIAVNSGAICPGNSFTLSPTGAANYTYSGGSNVVTPNLTTSYTITGTSAEGCAATNTAVATVSVVNTVTVSVTGNTTICSGQSTTLTANGAATYTWNSSTITTTIALSPSVTTTYTLDGASGTCSNTAMFTVNVNPNPTISVNSGSVCSGDSFTIVPTGAATYVYSGGSAVVNPASTTIYSVSGSSALGCESNTVTSIVTVVARPVISAVASNSIICLGESTMLSASGGTSYVWSDAQTGGSITITPTVMVMTYTVIGMGANGCANTATVMQRIDNCTAINKINNNNLIFGIYPNPNSGQFIVEAEQGVEITVVNSLGATVHSEKTGTASTSISIDHLANGIYFVKAVSHGKQQIVKVVKQ